jgi:hypothetical protein
MINFLNYIYRMPEFDQTMEVDKFNEDLTETDEDDSSEYSSDDEKENQDPELENQSKILRKQVHERLKSAAHPFFNFPLDFNELGSFQISSDAKATMISDLKKTSLLGITPAVKNVAIDPNQFLNIDLMMSKNPRLATQEGMLGLLEFCFATLGIKQKYDPPRLVSTLSLSDSQEIDLTSFFTSIIEKLHNWTYVYVKSDLQFNNNHEIEEVEFQDSKLFQHLLFYEAISSELISDVSLATNFIPETTDGESDSEDEAASAPRKLRLTNTLREEQYFQHLVEIVKNKKPDHNNQLEIEEAQITLTYERIYSLKSRQPNCHLATLLTFKHALNLLNKRHSNYAKSIGTPTKKEALVLKEGDKEEKDKLIKMRNNVRDQINADYISQLKEKFALYFTKYSNMSLTHGSTSYAERLHFTQRFSDLIPQYYMKIRMNMMQQILQRQEFTIFEKKK